MYETFYGLRGKPFSLLPDPEYLYLSKQHQMAMTLLEYSLETQAGFCVITGNIGTGKTTLIRYLLNLIGPDVSVGLISNTHQSFGELLRWILMAFDLDAGGKTKAELHRTFTDYLIGQYAKNKRTMLVVDEAQNMSPAALEELRMLSNINSEKDLVLQVMLVGQPGLRELLQRPELEQLTQRVAVDYHLKPLNLAETHGYIRHRITVAGGKPEIFSDGACDAVHRYSGGTPRLINLLCDTVLVYAYGEMATVITGKLVDQVVRDRQVHGVLQIFADGETPSEDHSAETIHVVEPPRKTELTPSHANRHADRVERAVAMMLAGQKSVKQEATVVEGTSTGSDTVVTSSEENVSSVASPPETAPEEIAAEVIELRPVTDAPISQDVESTTETESTESPMPENSNLQHLIPVATVSSHPVIRNYVLPLGLAAAVSAVAAGVVTWWMLSSNSVMLTKVSGTKTPVVATDRSQNGEAVLSAKVDVQRQAEIAPAAPVAKTAPDPAVTTVDGSAQLKLKTLVRERDAALARARAVERQRNAVIEAARVIADQEINVLRKQAIEANRETAPAEDEEKFAQALTAANAEKKMLEDMAAGEHSDSAAVESAPVTTAVEKPAAQE